MVKVNNEHDVGYKYLLSSKRVFLQLLESFVHEDWVDQVDPAAMEKMDKSYILQDFKQKESDLVYQMLLQDRKVIFYILMELQSTVDFQMPYRLLRYMTEIWRDVVKNTKEKERRKRDFRLPAIIPMVLYNGSDNWTVPLEFKGMLNTAGVLAEHIVNFEYILLDVNRYDEEELLGLSNLIGSVFYLDQDVESLEEIQKRLQALFESAKNLSEEEAALFQDWLWHIYSKRFPKEQQEEIKKVIKQSKRTEVGNMISGHGRNIDKFVKQSREAGLEEGIEKVAKSMLKDGMSIQLIAKYTRLSEEKIRQIQKED